MIAAARIAAYEIVREVSRGKADLPSAIAAARLKLRDERDRALAAEIGAGVQRSRAALNHLIVHFSRRRIDRLDAEIVDILRLSTYQLLYLSRVPAAAVVDDAVKLARRARKGSAAAFVNAVLRAISRGRNALPLPARPADPSDVESALSYFSVTLSHPRWLAERWYRRLGFEATESWLRFNNTAAPVTLRANRVLTTASELADCLRRDGIEAHAGRFAPDALIVDTGQPLRGTGLEAGWFVVQDEASQLVTLLVSARPGFRVLDTCASPGGKATALAAAVGSDGLVVACDVRDRRIDLLRRTVGAARVANIRIVQADLLRPLPFRPAFDAVIVDVPCSGLGTLRRDPDLRWRRRETDLPALAADELTMLRHASEMVSAGGRLVYATCSSEPEENEQVVDAFLTDAAGFVPLRAENAAPDLPRDVIDSRGHLRTEPHRHALEAFFGAVFERRRAL